MPCRPPWAGPFDPLAPEGTVLSFARMKPIPFFGFHEPVSSLSHFAAAILTLYAGWRLIFRTRGNGYRVGASFLYTACFLLLFSVSGSYHSLPPGPWRQFFQRLDYMSIWLVIAASATPIHMLLMRGFWRWALVGLFWAWALTGLVVLDRWHADLPYGAVVTLYLLVSVIAAASLYKLHRRFSPRTLAALTAGCLFYVAGALIDAFEPFWLIPGVFGPHETFHLFVVAGAACHYVFIYGWAEPRLRKVKTVVAGLRRAAAPVEAA